MKTIKTILYLTSFIFAICAGMFLVVIFNGEADGWIWTGFAACLVDVIVQQYAAFHL